MTVHEIVLGGCTPEPLMSYLKALGVFRILAEQNPGSVRACWGDEGFFLRTEFHEDALIDFFNFDGGYRPTPIFAPWNGDGGFLTDSGASFNTIESIKKSSDPHLEKLRDAIAAINQVSILCDFKNTRDRKKVLQKKKDDLKKLKQNLDEKDEGELKLVSKRVDEIKSSVLFSIRSGFPDEVVRWLDTCVVLGTEDFVAAPILGSGGCDGRMEFSANYLANLLIFFGRPPTERLAWIEHALMGRQGLAKLEATSVGQFAPGNVGGPNATQGFEGVSNLNPFDFILMIEGLLTISGAVTRKYAIGQSQKSSFPFTVYSSSVGSGSQSDSENKRARGEIWLPLWTRPATFPEVSHLFAEGRAELGRKQAATGVELAQAVASLGIDRGIASFSRYGFLPRSGRAFLATPLGRFDVHSRPDVDLVREADIWLEKFRIASSGANAPRFRGHLRAIEAAIFNFCQYGGPPRFANILCSIGGAERALSTAEKLRTKVRPMSGLSTEWLYASNEDSAEFDLALSLAGMYDKTRDGIGPLRTNLEPVEHGRWPGWAKAGKTNVWSSAHLATNLLAVLERRLMDGNRKGSEGLPLAHRRTASLDAISSFIAGETNDERLEELLWGLVLIDHAKPYPKLTRPRLEPPPVPRAFALLRLLFLPTAIETRTGAVKVRSEPAVTALLKAGRVGEACSIAMRRLRASGLTPMPHRTAGRPARDLCWSDSGVNPVRLAAALLFPINSYDLTKLMNLVLRREDQRAETAVGSDG